MIKKLAYISTFLFLFIATSCTYNFPEPDYTEDSFEGASFEKMYIIGDSFSSGLMDGILISEKQQYSFINIIGEKTNSYYEADLFNQAEVSSNLGLNFFEEDTSGEFELFYRDNESTVPAQRTKSGEELTEWTGSPFEINDFSVPNMRSFHTDDASILSENPYFNRLGIPENQSVLDIVIDQDPGVVIINLGTDDILGFSLRGATGEAEAEAGQIQFEDATPASDFEQAIRNILERLTSETSAEVVLSTVPNPIYSSYFNTLNYYMQLGREISAGEVNQLASYYNDFNQQVFEYNFQSGDVAPEDRRPIIDYDTNGGNRFRARVIKDETLSEVILSDGSELPKIRQMEEGELITFRLESDLHQTFEYGSITPLEDHDILTLSQQETINALVDQYNDIIRAIASEYTNVYLFELSDIIRRVKNEEIILDGVNYSIHFSREGVYSADGVFLNPRGQALVAYHLIERLNQLFDVSIRQISVNDYPGTSFQNE
jgi:hypothetical protein